MSSMQDRLPAVLTLCRELNAQRDLPRLLDRIAREASRLLDAERASVFLLDRERMELWTQVALGSEPFRFDARKGIAGAAALSGETINVRDARTDPRFLRDIDEMLAYETRSLLVVPLRNHEGEIIGAFEVLNRKDGPFTDDDAAFLEALAGQAAVAIETARLVQELERHRDELLTENSALRRHVEGRFSPRGILGSSERIQEIIRTIERIRDTSFDVLVTGESGTGKELVAKAIHYTSPRAARPLVALNCAALPESLVESELFGIEKEVATGVARRAGKFEEANGGTLFLDEIGDLPLAAQAKILRVLQERTLERVGGRRSISVDVRIVAATNKDLAAEVKQGTFRSDLYFRLNVIQLRTVPLREVPEDVPLLAQHFLAEACREMGRPRKTLGDDARAALARHGWPGNVRELQNEMKRAAVLSLGKVVQLGELSEEIRGAGSLPARGQRAAGSFHEEIESLERELIGAALEKADQNQQRAARALGLSRQGLIKKMKRYGMHPSAAGGAGPPSGGRGR